LDESDVRLEAGLEKKRKRKNVKMIGNKWHDNDNDSNSPVLDP
jgi:hypothetical protein